ncbi:MAG: hypothetical protein QG623_537 [Patescibacteria group bacterium]|nr:hypothetical protein [Patescibacteria group bacterium]
MSETATSRTEKLILGDLPRVFEGTSTERWEAVAELRAKAEEIAGDNVDENFIRELAIYNSGRYGLDCFEADKVFGVVRKPAGGSLAAMHSPSHRVWLGTGACLATTTDGEVVHYINRPGEVEERYGSALPYILDKLAWLAIARDIKGHRQVHSGEGYRYVANRLNRIGRRGTHPHIGSIAANPEGLFGVREDMPVLLASASGTLPSDFHDFMYEAHMPSLRERANIDREAGLFDGYERNKRAGIYDIAFAEMICEALYGRQVNDQMLSLFDVPGHFADVDIN